AGNAGNDLYYVDSAADVITENANEGIDTVYSSVNNSLADQVENLVLTGTAISGTGNAFDNELTGNASDNNLSGGDGNDTLIGGLGNDTLAGGLGNDFYYIDTAGDVVTENSDEGIDTVYSRVNSILDADIENLNL